MLTPFLPISQRSLVIDSKIRGEVWLLLKTLSPSPQSRSNASFKNSKSEEQRATLVLDAGIRLSRSSTSFLPIRLSLGGRFNWAVRLSQRLQLHVHGAERYIITFSVFLSRLRSLALEKANKKPSAPQGSQIIADAISKEMVAGITHVNIAQETIWITEDRAYRCLSDWKTQIQMKDSWVAPVCLLASLLFSFVTSTFRDAFGIPKETWQAVAIIAIGGSGFWTVRELWKVFMRWRNNDRDGSIDGLMNLLKKGALVVQWGSSEQPATRGASAKEATSPIQETPTSDS